MSGKAIRLDGLRVAVAAVCLAACGGDGGGDGTGPAPDQFAQVQLTVPLSDRFAIFPIILFDSTPIPSDFQSSLGLTGTLFTGAGQVDRTPGITIEWAIESGGGSLATSTTAAQDGSVQNQWFLGPLAPGTIQGIVLTSPTFPAYSQHIRLRIYQAPLQLERTSNASDTTGIFGTPLPDPFSVRLLDGNGVPLPRALIWFHSNGTLTYLGETLNVPYGYCSQEPPLCQNGDRRVFSYTDADGTAAVRVTLPTTANSYVNALSALPEMPVLFEGSRVVRGPGVGWQFIVEAGPAAQITIQSGNNQAGSTGGTLPLPLVVRVTDQYGNPRADDPVTWAVVSGGGSVASTTTRTGTDGRSSNIWTLGGLVGTQTVSATAGPATVTFSATVGS